MKTIITIIRAAVGWHFLYEGLIKLFAGNWSAASYLNNTYGFLSGFFQWLAASPARLEVVDFLNVWGLLLIGLALFLGLFIRWASLAGALLLTMYYFAYPPFGFSLGGDGTTYIVNQLFIETAILAFFVCYREKGHGLDDLIQWLKKKKQKPAAIQSDTAVNSRREVLKNLATLPVLGLFGWGAFHRNKIYGADALSGATIQINRLSINELKGEMPKGKIGKHELSRLMVGGNLFSANMHPRDLRYVNSLSKAYNTERKIFETLILAEQAGLNCVSIDVNIIPSLIKYKKLTGSTIKSSIHVTINEKGDMFENVKKAADGGVDLIHMMGSQSDIFVRDNNLGIIGKTIDEIRSQGCVAGLCAHTIDTLIICEEYGIIPDYYMKTMHHDKYWSAHPRENRKKYEFTGIIKDNFSLDHNMFHDNLWDPFSEQTIEFVNRVQTPVIGFKVLAAGAIPPRDGFKWAFENGADFICVGMFDFQVVGDVNICIETLQNLKNRKRGWYA